MSLKNPLSLCSPANSSSLPSTRVLSGSKKIKKTTVSSPDSPKKKKRYKIFDTIARKAILSSLRNVLKTKELVHPENSLSSGDLLKILDSLGLDKLNEVLHETLKQHVLSFKPDVRSLRQWRRKIREWVTSSEKPETRGNVLIPHEKLSLFKKHLTPEILSMATRNVVLAKQKVLQVFKIIGHPVPAQSCSKHWWYKFLERHAEIKEVWDALPKRANRKNGNKHVSGPDSESEPESPTESTFEEDKIEIGIKEDDCPLPMEVGWENEPFWDELMEERPLDFTLSPRAFHDVKKVERLMSWREARTIVEPKDPVIEDFNNEFLPGLDRENFETGKEGAIELLEYALNLSLSI